MSFTSRPRSILTLAVVALGAPWLSGCEDNITCVFTTGCADTPGGGALGAEATLPENGFWIRDSQPTIERIAPDQRIDLPMSTPVVIVFSESMNAESLEGAIEIVPDDGGFPGLPVPGIPQTLTADGRVLVLLPTQLPEADYMVQLSENSMAVDITGQALDESSGEALASFSVVEASAGDDPRLLTTWPANNDQNQGDTSAVLVVFDRPVAGPSVTQANFVVLVDGLPPLASPPAEALQIGFMGAFTSDMRGYVWQSRDPAGGLVPLGSSANVDVELNPMGVPPIVDAEGDALANESFGFVTTPFASPVTSSIASMPMDAIGLPNLDAAQDPLTVDVNLSDAMVDDTLDLFLVGTSVSGMPPPLFALRRSITVGASGPQMARFMLADIDITTSNGTPRFADGPVSFAFRLRRSGTLVSPLQVMDVDANRPGIDDPVLDTTAPEVSELLFPGGGTDAYVSDLRDLVIAGQANEAVSRVEITTPAIGNNGMNLVVGSNSSGTFVSAPVVLPNGFVPGGSTAFTLRAFDSAGNGSSPINGTYTQRGAVGPGAFTPGDMVNVEVYDAQTLAPIMNALVTLHDDEGDGVDFPLSQAGMTLSDGTIALTSGAGAVTPVGALVTVDAAGYDLFTFHGITSSELSIPLMPVGAAATGLVTGTVVTTDQLANLLLPFLSSKVDDPRRPSQAPRTYDVRACTGAPLLCPYGPEPMRRARLGLQSYFAGDFMLTEGGFNPGDLLQAFCLEIPIAPIAVDAMFPQDTSFQLPFMLSDPSVAPEEVPVELFQGTAVTLRADLSTEIDLGNLVGDMTTTGDPRITVETVVPGVPGSFAVGLGLAYDQGGGDTWTLRAAAPGAVTPGGFFGMTGAVDTDLFIRCELRDAQGRVAGARPRESNLGSLFSPNEPFVTDPSVLLAPAEMSTTAGASYNVDFQDVIPDQYEMGQRRGIYRVVLEGVLVRRWELWTMDPAGMGTVTVHLPDITSVGGNPLPTGDVEAEIESYAWPSLDVGQFFWSDVEREHDLFSFSRMFTFQQP